MLVNVVMNYCGLTKKKDAIKYKIRKAKKWRIMPAKRSINNIKNWPSMICLVDHG